MHGGVGLSTRISRRGRVGVASASASESASDESYSAIARTLRMRARMAYSSSTLRRPVRSAARHCWSSQQYAHQKTTRAIVWIGCDPNTSACTVTDIAHAATGSCVAVNCDADHPKIANAKIVLDRNQTPARQTPSWCAMHDHVPSPSDGGTRARMPCAHQRTMGKQLTRRNIAYSTSDGTTVDVILSVSVFVLVFGHFYVAASTAHPSAGRG